MEKVKVMVVDDSRISRMMVSSMLAKTNFEVCAMAENSAEAVALYAKTKKGTFYPLRRLRKGGNRRSLTLMQKFQSLEIFPYRCMQAL